MAKIQEGTVNNVDSRCLFRSYTRPPAGPERALDRSLILNASAAFLPRIEARFRFENYTVQ
jgi:hypothetical protein